ncbi:MAG TPA: ABC transporter permease [bacterium]|nr:ABC transporter permease [bacterium]
MSDQPGAVPASGRPAAGHHEIEAARPRWASGIRRPGGRPLIPAAAWLPTAGSLLVFLAVWQILSRFYPPILLPGPAATFGALWDLFARDNLARAFATSIQSLLIGLGLAIPTGIVLGFLAGVSRPVERAIGPFLDALYVTPKIMLIPLFIIWFGVGTEARIAYIFVVSYFPLVVNTFAGVRSMRDEFTETARAFLAGPLEMFRDVYLPGSIPFIVAGIRLALGHAIVGMITAEMFLAIVGLGYMVVNFGNRLATAKVLALAIFVSLFGVAVTELVKWSEHRLAPWTRRDTSS